MRDREKRRNRDEADLDRDREKRRGVLDLLRLPLDKDRLRNGGGVGRDDRPRGGGGVRRGGVAAPEEGVARKADFAGAEAAPAAVAKDPREATGIIDAGAAVCGACGALGGAGTVTSTLS